MEVARQVRWPGHVVAQQQVQVRALALSQSFLLRDPVSFGCLLHSYQQIEELVVNIHSLITSFICTGHQASLCVCVCVCIIILSENLLYQESLGQKGPWKILIQIHAFYFWFFFLSILGYVTCLKTLNQSTEESYTMSPLFAQQSLFPKP